MQLNKEIKRWITDIDTRQILQPWIESYGKILYLLTILSGSAFSAVELCDSHMFQLPLFSLDIPQRQKQTFKNKRIFSIVLLENIPQFCIQVSYLLLIDSKNDNIALIAMCFSVLSIILTLFEYNTKKYVFESEYLMIVKFKVDSSIIKAMTSKEWIQQVANNRSCIKNEIAKTLNISYYHVEQLKPIRYPQGALITCHVRADIMFVQATKAMDALQESILVGRLQKVCVLIVICVLYNIINNIVNSIGYQLVCFELYGICIFVS